MSELKELQDSIDNFSINPDELPEDKRDILDSLFNDGSLDGYNSFSDYSNKFGVARRQIATRKEIRAEPAKESLLGSRGSFELTGELLGSFLPYMMDKKKLTNYYENNNYQTKLGVNFKSKFYNSMSKMGNLLEKINVPTKGGKIGAVGRLAEPLFKRTSALLKRASQGKFDPKNPIITQPEATYGKSFLGAVGGAGLGSVAYDAYNLNDNYAAAVQADLAGISDNEVFQKDPLERTLINAQAAMSTSLLFNGGAAALTPLGRLIKGKVKTVLGVDTKEAKALAEQALARGINLNLPSLASEDKFIGKLTKDYFKTIGILPILGAIGSKFKQRLASEVGSASVDILENMAPVQHASILGNASQPIIRGNLVKNASLVSEQYELTKAYGDILQKQLGVDGIIPMTNLAKGAKQFTDDFLPKLPKARTGRTPDDLQEDPRLKKMLEDSDFAYLYTKFADFGMTDASGKFIGAPVTLREWMDTKKIINNLIKKEAPDSEAAIKYKEIMKLMDDDLAAVSNVGTQNSLLNSAEIQAKYRQIVESEGQEAANEFLNKVALGVSTFGDMLTRANEFFVQNIQPFGTKTAEELKKIDSYLFAVKGLIPGFQGKAAVEPSEIYQQVFRKILADGSPESVTRMQQLIGAIPMGKDLDSNVYGQELYKRLVSRNFYDNFLGSFDLKNFDEPVKMASDFIKEAQKKGVYGKYIDEAFDEAFQKNDNLRLKFLTPQALKEGVGEVDVKQIKAKFDELGEFDIDQFMANFGLVGTSAQIAKGEARLGQIYAGLGHDPKKSVETFKEFTNIVKTAFEFDVGDTSKFLTRRLAIGGSIYGAFALGGQQAGVAQDLGFFGNTVNTAIDMVLPTVMFRYASGVIASPRTMRSLLDVYTPRQREKKIGKGALLSKPGLRTILQPVGGAFLSPSKRRTLAAIVNNLTTSDPGAPQVDPKKLDFREVQDFLLNTEPKVPVIQIDPEKMLDDKELKQRHPEIYTSRFLSDEEKNIRNQLSKGEVVQSIANDEESNQEINATLPMPMAAPEQQAINQQLPQQNPTVAPGAAPTNVAQNSNSFRTLFPNDPVGQLIAERGSNART